MDQLLASLVTSGIEFQRSSLCLVAAANYLSEGVVAAMHPALESLHCEGYPGHRYHEGQAVSDAIERLAVERACRLFGVEHANVQPYRGTMANLAAAMAVVPPGGVVMGLQTAAGGHYSTGGGLHLLGRMFRVVPYGLGPDSARPRYDLIARLAHQERPAAIFCGDTSYPRLWDWAALRAVADEVGAVLIADVSQSAGLIAGGAVPSPAPYADILTAATYKTLRGPRAGLILSRAALAPAVDRAVYPICQGGTNVRVIAGVAQALGEALDDDFRDYAGHVVDNARRLAAELVTWGFDLVTGGTDNHACLVDLSSSEVSGDVAAGWLATAGIVANGNQIPGDPRPPRHPSGLRFGTAAVTSLGMDETTMIEIASLIARVLRNRGDADDAAVVRERVARIRKDFAAGVPASGLEIEELV